MEPALAPPEAPENPYAKPCILVTGSAGLIGRRLVRRLAQDYRIFGFDRDLPQRPIDGVTDLSVDLTEDDAVESALAEVRQQSGGKLAGVIHLAAYYNFTGEPSDLYEKLTVEGTRRLLRGLQSFERVGQFQFLSTLLVMQPAEQGEKLSSDDPVDPKWDYPRSKVETEAVIREERGQFPAVVIRLAGAYDEEGHSPPLCQQMSRIYEKKLEGFFFPGDASHGQSFIHLDDTVEALRICLERRAVLGDYEVFLLGEEDVMSYAELQETIGQCLWSRDWPTIRIPKVAAKVGACAKDKLADEEHPDFIKPWMIDLADQHMPIDLTEAKRVLGGWTPQRSLRRTLPEMVNRLTSDPRKWYAENGLPLPDKLQEEDRTDAEARS
jgi:nucleoside-diphosphate-sugar epimerase